MEARSLSSIQILPLVTLSNPDRQLSSVVLPQPEGPITPTTSPLAISRLTPLRAWNWALPVSYILTTLSARTIEDRAVSAGVAACMVSTANVVVIAPPSVGLPENDIVPRSE